MGPGFGPQVNPVMFSADLQRILSFIHSGVVHQGRDLPQGVPPCVTSSDRTTGIQGGDTFHRDPGADPVPGAGV